MVDQSLRQLVKPASNNAESSSVLEQPIQVHPRKAHSRLLGLTVGGKPDPLYGSSVRVLDVSTSGEKFLMLNNSYYMSPTQGASIFRCLRAHDTLI